MPQSAALPSLGPNVTGANIGLWLVPALAPVAETFFWEKKSCGIDVNR